GGRPGKILVPQFVLQRAVRRQLGAEAPPRPGEDRRHLLKTAELRHERGGLTGPLAGALSAALLPLPRAAPAAPRSAPPTVRHDIPRLDVHTLASLPGKIGIAQECQPPSNLFPGARECVRSAARPWLYVEAAAAIPSVSCKNARTPSRAWLTAPRQKSRPVRSTPKCLRASSSVRMYPVSRKRAS